MSFSFFSKKTTTPGSSDSKKPDPKKVTIDQTRFTVMPEKIVVTPDPVQIPVEKPVTPPPPMPIPQAQKMAPPKAPKAIIPELQSEHRLLLLVAIIIVSGAVIGSGIGWWYSTHQKTNEPVTPEVSLTVPHDIGLATNATDAGGHTIGSIRVRIPSASQVGDTSQYRVIGAQRDGAVSGAYSFTPSGLTLGGPISIVISFFASDAEIAGVAAKDLVALEAATDGTVHPFGISTVDINTNEVTVAATSFPAGQLFLGAGPSKTATIESAQKNKAVPFKEYVLRAPTAITLSSDIDRDGLTDLEEEAYGTKADVADTDGDGYADGLETRNLYDPAKKADARLLQSSVMRLFSHTNPDISVAYPAVMIADGTLDGDLDIILFTPPETGEVIELISGNLNGKSLAEWYASEGGDPTAFKAGLYRGQPALFSTDGMTVYWIENGRAWGWIYQAGVAKEINYRTTFEAMQKSLSIGANTKVAPDAIVPVIVTKPSSETSAPAVAPSAPASDNGQGVQNNVSVPADTTVPEISPTNNSSLTTPNATTSNTQSQNNGSAQ